MRFRRVLWFRWILWLSRILWAGSILGRLRLERLSMVILNILLVNILILVEPGLVGSFLVIVPLQLILEVRINRLEQHGHRVEKKSDVGRVEWVHWDHYAYWREDEDRYR